MRDFGLIATRFNTTLPAPTTGARGVAGVVGDRRAAPAGSTGMRAATAAPAGSAPRVIALLDERPDPVLVGAG